MPTSPSYRDDAESEMPEDDLPVRITRVVLRPQIVVAAGTDLDEVRILVETAHGTCYVANTLNSAMVVEATVEHAPEPGDG